MQKRIAVFICAISLENQKRHLEGILRVAKESGILCYVFTCHVSFQASEESKMGAYRILTLPDLSEFDGAILMKNTIQYPDAADALVEKIRAAKIPAVSIDAEIDGMKCVTLDNYRAQYEVVRHLIKKHHAKNLVYLSGHPGNTDTEERKRAFYDACHDFDIPSENQTEIIAHFATDLARMGVEEYIRKNGLPDAFVCANDQMAMGAHFAVTEAGYHIPEDVAITGFDGDSIVEAYSPVISTADKHSEKIGATALQMLFDTSGETRKTLYASFRAGGSCGCPAKEKTVSRSFRGEYLAQTMMTVHAGDFMRNMSAEFAKAETVSEIYEIMKRYIETGENFSTFVMMCDEKEVFYRETLDEKSGQNRIDLQNVNQEYTKNVTSVVTYLNGEYRPPFTFPSAKVLPREIEAKVGADYYIVVPISYLNCCFGYMISSNSKFAKESEIFYLWLSNVEIALENIRKQILLRSLTDKLNEMWVYDAMTNLYNRAGFLHFSDEYLLDLKARDAAAYLLFIDLDGLKTVNDTLGHETGDRYIAAMGEIIRTIKKPKDLAMRYGGDEFVVFGECMGDEARILVADIEKEMKRFSFGEENQYTLSASIGCIVRRANKISDLGEIIREADMKMYETKRRRKAKKIKGE